MGVARLFRAAAVRVKRMLTIDARAGAKFLSVRRRDLHVNVVSALRVGYDAAAAV